MGFAVFRAAEGAQGAELGQCRIFQDIDEVVFIQWVHRSTRRLAMEHNMYYAQVYVNIILYLER